MSDNIYGWIIFNTVIFFALALDLFIHRSYKPIKVKEAISWSIFWISLALLFNLYVYYSRGTEAAYSFLTGYLIEKSLSVDNLFVFLLIFRYFKTPEAAMHKVLFWGVLGAILMRAIFIGLGIVLLDNFHWMIYVFGAFLVLTGIKLAFEKEKEIKPERNPLLRLFRHFFPVSKDYHKDHFLVKIDGKYLATPLLVVLIVIETTDIIFAVDSIPAILAITNDPFIVYTSNIFAILGLRSLYFLLQHIMGLFYYLHYGLAFILVFIGVKMLLEGTYEISTLASLAVVFGALAISVLVSIFFPIKDEGKSH